MRETIIFIVLGLVYCAKAEEYDDYKKVCIDEEEMFCQRVYQCMGIKLRYDTPNGVAVYEYEPKTQLHFALASGDAKDGLRLGNHMERGIDDGMFITLDQSK